MEEPFKLFLVSKKTKTRSLLNIFMNNTKITVKLRFFPRIMILDNVHLTVASFFVFEKTRGCISEDATVNEGLMLKKKSNMIYSIC